MSCPVPLDLLPSICLFCVLFFSSFFSLWLNLLCIFITVCICCVLAFYSGVATKTDAPVSPPPFRKLTYDVFLSFRGEDTRTNFTDHLFTALKQKGVFTFRDDEQLERGKSIAPELLKAIEESRYVVVVLSRNYANSSWCLDEIVTIVDCMEVMGQIVIPVFYHVDPSDVRKQNGEHFGAHFLKHEVEFKDEPERVRRWRRALLQVGNLSGWHVQQNGSEARVIQEVVNKIFTELNDIMSISEGLVGMDSHLNEMLPYLGIGCPDVRIIGISGMGGIGKTTIAQVVYEKILAQFEGYSFLENIRAVIEDQGAVHLQQQLLSNLLKSDVNVHNTKMGKNIMAHRLSTKMVLIVLDDVDEEEQLEALCDRKWFGPGSRIIITSRDEHLLTAVGADNVYKVNPLNETEAFKLFSLKAFKGEEVEEDFLKLSKEFLKYADGFPLAIKVLGSSVRGRRNVKLWSSLLARQKKHPQKKIINALKVSFDGLEDREKKTFLDIACFFKGEDIDRVIRILRGSDDQGPDFDVQVLMDKAMVTLFGRKLWMHDSIQEMGWEVVRKECPDRPEKRSRLWLLSDIIHVLDRNKATSRVQSIFLKGPTKYDTVHSVNDSFSKMDRLRLLKILDVKFSGNIKYLSNELEFLQWHNCPLDSFPSEFQPDKLVELHMHSSRIKQLWQGEKGWCMLRLIDLTNSHYLMSTPDFTNVPDLEVLVLENCTGLVEVHPSLGFLKKLISLNMRNCKSVESIPSLTSLKSLKVFKLSNCSRVKKFPEIEGNMKSLLEVHLDGTLIEELPPSVESLTSLTMLNLRDCKNLLRLPSAILCLTSLKSLYLAGCSKLDVIPENLNCVEGLESLYIDGTAIRELSFVAGMKNLQYLSSPGCKGLSSDSCKGLLSLSSLTSLIELDLSDCNLMDEAIPDDLSGLNSLRRLDLSGNSFVRLPESICQLTNLQTLDLSNCKQLQVVPNLPSSVRYVLAVDCTALMDYPNQFKILTSLESGVIPVNSLSSSSSAPRDFQNLKAFTVLPKVQGHCEMNFSMRADEDKEWRQVDHLPLPIPLLAKDMEVSHNSSSQFSIIQVDNEIPEWFTSISTRNSISIPISPNHTDDNKWKGIAACAVFKFKGRTDVSIIERDSEIPDYFYQCTMETDVVCMKPSVVDGEVIRTVRTSSHLLLMSYLCSSKFPVWGLNQSTVVAARFETNNPFMDVQTCGIRLVYEQDAGWYTKLFPLQITTHLNEIEGAILESGWHTQVDKYLKWETFVPLCELDSTILLRKNIEYVLPRYLEALNHNSAMYTFNLSGNPAWFESFYTHTGSSASIENIELPQNLHRSKKWMGFAIYASIAEEQQHRTNEDCYIYLRLKIGNYYKDLCEELKYVRSSEEHQQLLVVYIPREEIPEECMHTSPTVMDIYFITDSPHVEFQRSGIRIVYHEDLQGFVKAIIQCMQREDALEFYDKLVVESWIKLIQLQGHLEGTCSLKERDHDSRLRRETKFKLLSQKYRNWDWSAPASFLCFFYGAEMMRWKWFMHFTKGNSAEIELPPVLFDDANWLGIAICALCWESREHQSISLGSTPDSDHTVLTCCLDSDVASDGIFDVKLQMLVNKLKPWDIECDFSYFIYIPRARYLKFWRQCNLARVTFWSSSPCLGLDSCALRLVFKNDVEDLVQILTHFELP